MTREIVILGMHRCGTSLLTNLVAEMGAYPGEQDDLIGENKSNPKGHWERTDIRQLNDAILAEWDCDWNKVSKLCIDGANSKHTSLQAKQTAVEILNALKSKNKDIVIKEPRLSLLLSFWGRILHAPIFLIAYRDPVEVASSLDSRNHIPMSVGMALWEIYLRAAIQGTINHPRMALSYNDLLQNPEQAAECIFTFLRDHGASSVRRLTDAKVQRIVDRRLHREQRSLIRNVPDLSHSQKILFESLQKDDFSKLDCDDSNYHSLKDLLELYEESSVLRDFTEQFVQCHNRIQKTYHYRLTSTLVSWLRSMIFQTPARSRPEQDAEHVLREFCVKRVTEWSYISRSDRREREEPPLPIPHGIVDILVTVHNALDYVKTCLASLERTRSEFRQLILVDDASEEPTEMYLQTFSNERPWCRLIRNQHKCGYTKTANTGLRASNADVVILLNSDVEVGSKWIARIMGCLTSDSSIGIASPLSNAASWQSIPDVLDASQRWAVNEMPGGWTIESINQSLQYLSECKYPLAPVLNGFCFAIKKEVIQQVGYFDEKNFPSGYGEENDYCLRAQSKGYSCAVVDDAYIYHHKTKSHAKEERLRLASAGNEALKVKYGASIHTRIADSMKNLSALRTTRKRMKKAFSRQLYPDTVTKRKILFLLPCLPGGGGVNSVIQEAGGLCDLGCDVVIAIPACHKKNYERMYSTTDTQLMYFYICDEELLLLAKRFSTIIATYYKSVYLLKKIVKQQPSVTPVYYIQDYEPWICGHNLLQRYFAKKSYTAVKEMLCIAKTDWLCEIVKKKCGVNVEKIIPSIDHHIYHPNDPTTASSNEKTIIAAMVRPRTARRNARGTMQILRRIKQRYDSRVDIVIFGCGDDEISQHSLEERFEFRNLGILPRSKVAEVLRTASIFLDMSSYQAFGRTGVEAMACRCVPVLPILGGAGEYAVDGKNACLVDTSKADQVCDVLAALIDNTDKRQEMSMQGIRDAKRYSAQRSAYSMYLEIAAFYASKC